METLSCPDSPPPRTRLRPGKKVAMNESTARAMIQAHFDASNVGASGGGPGDDIVRASEIYADDAVVEWPRPSRCGRGVDGGVASATRPAGRPKRGRFDNQDDEQVPISLAGQRDHPGGCGPICLCGGGKRGQQRICDHRQQGPASPGGPAADLVASRRRSRLGDRPTGNPSGPSVISSSKSVGPSADAPVEAARTRMLSQANQRCPPGTNATLDQLLDRSLAMLEVGRTTHRIYTRYLDEHVRRSSAAGLAAQGPSPRRIPPPTASGSGAPIRHPRPDRPRSVGVQRAGHPHPLRRRSRQPGLGRPTGPSGRASWSSVSAVHPSCGASRRAPCNPAGSEHACLLP